MVLLSTKKSRDSPFIPPLLVTFAGGRSMGKHQPLSSRYSLSNLPLRPLFTIQRLLLAGLHGELHHALRDLTELHNVGKSIFSGQSGIRP